MREVLGLLARNLPVALGAIAAVVAVLAVLLALLALRRRAPAPSGEEPAGEGEAPGTAVTVDFRQAGQRKRLSSAFDEALAVLRRHLGGRGARYRLPWFLLLGEASGKRGLLAGCGLHLPLGPPQDPAPEEGAGCSFWFFERGIVLDVSGDYVLPSGGSPAHERRWKHLLRLLRRHRPRRPVDGVVVTLPCAGLTGPADGHGQRIARAADQGAILSRKLRGLEERLGMTFPVYVLVTGCEEVPGFGSFAAQIPEERRGGLFGWSNPYVPETAFSPAWVDEALAGVDGGLQRAALEIYGRPGEVADPDGVFGFAEELPGVREALRVYLSQMFRPSSWHEALPLRGVYFCGTAAGAGEAAFARDVFERKVFAERGLARPGTGALARAGRAVQAARLAALAAVLGLAFGTLWAGWSLAERRGQLAAFLRRVSADLPAGRRAGDSPEELRDKAGRLVSLLGDLDGTPFRSVFLPASWGSPISRDLDRVVVRSYEEILFAAFRDALDRRRARIEGSPGGWIEGGGPEAALPEETDPGAPVEAFAVADTAELRALLAHVRAVRAFEADAARYNGLKEPLWPSRRMQGLAELSRSLLGISLPRGFLHRPGIRDRALRRAGQEPYPVAAANARRRLHALSARLADRLFRRNPILAEARAAAESLGQVEPGRSGLAGLELVRDRLARAGAAVSDPVLAWSTGKALDLGPAFRGAVAEIRAARLLGPGEADRVVAGQTEGLVRFEREVRSLSLSYTGRLIERDPKSGRLVLAADARRLSSAIDGLLGEPFTRLDGGALDTPVPAGSRVAWDADRLREAAGLYEPYQEFVRQRLSLFEPGLSRPLEDVARHQVGEKIVETVEQALRVLPDSPEEPSASAAALVRRIEGDLSAFETAGPLLDQLAGILARLRLPAAAQRLSGLREAEGAGLLAAVDRLLALRRPYDPADPGFSSWSGDTPPAPQAFGVRSAGDLAALLEAERAEIETASAYAAPVLARFGAGGRSVRDPAFRRRLELWTGIADQMARLQAGKPANSAAALETFIREDLSRLTPADCGRVLPAETPAEAPAHPDFFLEKRQRLKRQAFERCRALQWDRARAAYAEIAAAFGRLAGRFPFDTEPPGRAGREAEPGEIRAFFRRWDRAWPLLRTLVEDGRAPAGVRAFLAGMRDVRALFAPFLDDPRRPELPGFGLAVRFRTRRTAERGGDRIIRWEVSAGESRLAYPRNGAVSWTAGDPVRLTLEWAKDGPAVPVAAASPAARIHGRSVVYEYGNRWALFALLRELSAPDPSGESDAARLLTLAVETRPAGNPAGPPESVRVYLGALLQAPAEARQEASAAVPGAGPEPPPDLALPEFPTAAPPWKADGGTP